MAVMLSFNRRTIRRFIDRMRPARREPPQTPPPPTPPLPSAPDPRGRRFIDSVVIERFTLTPSSSDAAGLLDETPSSPSNSVAEGSVTPAFNSSVPSNGENNAGSSSQSSYQDDRALNATPDPIRRALEAFKMTGIIRNVVQPAADLAPSSSAQANNEVLVPKPDPPVLHFNGLFALPATSEPPVVPQPVSEASPPIDEQYDEPQASPPIDQEFDDQSDEEFDDDQFDDQFDDDLFDYQPIGPQEAFPPLPLTPVHANTMAAQSGAPILPYEIPGDDRFPHTRGFRPINGSVLGAPSERFTVSGRTFYCPLHLLLNYPHWHLLLSLQRPANGWNIVMDPAIFLLVMETLVSASGFQGTEQGLNLTYIVLGCRQAYIWGMDQEVKKLVATYRGYIARRIFYRNPYKPDRGGYLNHNYFVYRSEEIFRAWEVLNAAPDALKKMMPPTELLSIYSLLIPADMWPSLTAHLPDEFADAVEFLGQRLAPGGTDFDDWWLQSYTQAGLLEFTWIGDSPSALNFF